MCKEVTDAATTLGIGQDSTVGGAATRHITTNLVGVPPLVITHCVAYVARILVIIDAVDREIEGNVDLAIAIIIKKGEIDLEAGTTTVGGGPEIMIAHRLLRAQKIH